MILCEASDFLGSFLGANCSHRGLFFGGYALYLTGILMALFFFLFFVRIAPYV